MGIGDWFPTKGEAEGQIRVKGTVGSKGAGMRRTSWKGRARRKRETKPENSMWIDQSMWRQAPGSSAATIGPYGANEGTSQFITGTCQRIVVINPVGERINYLLESAGTDSASAAAIVPGSMKIKRFQGQIWMTQMLPIDDVDINLYTTQRIFVRYAWMKDHSSAVNGVQAATSFDLFSLDAEQRSMMSRRDLLAYGTICIGRQPMGPGSLPTTAWSMLSTWRQQMLKIPLPRLGREGLRVDRDTSITLFAQARTEDLNYDPATSAYVWTDSPLNGDRPIVMQDFRMLVSFDD